MHNLKHSTEAEPETVHFFVNFCQKIFDAILELPQLN